MTFPRRIVCLTEETTETLYLLGQEDRIVGVSGYTVRPPAARKKPRVSAFTTAKFDRILGLHPDLVLAFSDLQAEISAELIRRGVAVLTFNQRSVTGIFEMIQLLGRIVDAPDAAMLLVHRLQEDLDSVRASALRLRRRPRVFFEEWNDPLISGIRWVDELVELAGGEPLFPHLRHEALARNRILDPRAVAERNPEIVIGSWCGVRFNPVLVRERPGWSKVDAVLRNRIFEVKSTYILQPGPAALTEGIRQLHYAIATTMGIEVPQPLKPREKTDPAIRFPPPEVV